MSRRYPGIRTIEEGRVYEINYQRNHKRRQYRVEAESEKEAYDIKIKDMTEFNERMKISGGNYKDTEISFDRALELLCDDVTSDTKNKKTLQHYQRTFHKIYNDLRKLEFPGMHSVCQTSIQMLKRYKNYYVNELGYRYGWRAELIFVKAMIKRFYTLKLCRKELLDELDLMRKPERNKKEYSNIPDSKIKLLLNDIEKTRPDYYAPIYFIARTGRRIEETTLIDRKDVVWDSLNPIKIDIQRKTTKQKKKLPVPILDKDLQNLIKKAYTQGKRYKNSKLFINRLGRKCQQSKIRECLKDKSRELIGVEITPHYFRHRFLTNCALRSVPIRDAMAIAGITDIKIVLEHYCHTTDEGLTRALKVSLI